MVNSVVWRGMAVDRPLARAPLSKPAGVHPRWAPLAGAAVASALCFLAAGCAPPAVANFGASPTPHVRHAWRPPASTPIPLPDRALLERQPTPDCAFRGPVSNPMTAEETRQKLDYEQQCYRQAETNVRGRLDRLQDSVEETVKAVNGREARR